MSVEVGRLPGIHVPLPKRVSAARDDKMYAEEGRRYIARIADIALFMNRVEG